MHPQLYIDRTGHPAIYVAGSSAEWSMVQGHIRALRNAGFNITHDWTEQVSQARAENKSDKDFTTLDRRTYAWDDLHGVLAARFFWLVAPTGTSTGAWVELGAALTLGKITVTSGDVSRCIFADLAAFHFKTHEEARNFLIEHQGVSQ